MSCVWYYPTMWCQWKWFWILSSFDEQHADHMLLTVQLVPLHPFHLPCRYVSGLSCDKSGTKTCISSSSHFATSNMIICFMTSLSSSTTSHVGSGAAVNMCSIPHFSSLSFKTSFCHLLQKLKNSMWYWRPPPTLATYFRILFLGSASKKSC